MTQIISFNQSNLASTKLVPNFVKIGEGDVLSITNNTFCKEMPNGQTVEMFIFENQFGEKMILGLNQILKSRGSVANSLQKAIWNKDIQTGKDLFFVLQECKIRVSHIDYTNVTMPDGLVRCKLIYTFDWA